MTSYLSQSEKQNTNNGFQGLHDLTCTSVPSVMGLIHPPILVMLVFAISQSCPACSLHLESSFLQWFLYGCFSHTLGILVQMSLSHWDLSFFETATPPQLFFLFPFPDSFFFITLTTIWHSLYFNCFIISLPPLGCKLHNGRNFCLFCSLFRILFGPSESQSILV